MLYFAFPGCFNPPTLAHLAIAKSILKKYPDSKVIFIPVSDYYLKKDLAPAKDRCQMLKLVVGKNMIISDIEIKSKFQPKTLVTLNKLKRNYPNLRLLIGSDNYRRIKTWYHYQTLLKKYSPEIVKRNSSRLLTISSSKIRSLIKRGQSCSRYLDSKVIKYINDHRLYR
ncbi:MAG TPA: nicotinate-nicotinamide nucleotide adenylyltransferase [Candidatus Woesebacteria bacterium]|nr:nicotinate-nicotinamide nucleotide adenylyltransferase [Candidatus Woesebacteria bacterium]